VSRSTPPSWNADLEGNLFVSIDPFLFRQVMSHFASGVTVVTTAAEGYLSGITVSSFTSLSLEPTLVLICIDLRSTTHAAIATSGLFAVNMLTEEQAHLSQRFAAPNVERFVPGSFTLSERGLPLLVDTLASLECRVVNAFPGGDHTIYVGEVVAARTGSGRPLLYYRSGYRQLD
jgi:flavin reductase (DIM6/NTAB) family NADH-FMN oxidoreductase RutF